MNQVLIENFFHDLRQDTLADSEVHNDFLETEFLTTLSSELEESGIIAGFENCHYRALRGMRVDGYWFRDGGSVLDLFILDFENRDSLESLTRTDISSIYKRLENFFIASAEKKLYESLEETSQGYGLARDIWDRKKGFRRINMILMSERKLSERIQEIEDKAHNNWHFSYDIWDISRFFRHQTSKGSKEELIVDFKERYNQCLPCLPAHLQNTDYESYLLVMPAEIIADLYDRYGGRLLEQNVRCFLQARSNVNKGLRATIRHDPEMFFAYNNGITATAKEIVTEKTETGLSISQIKDLQIVNGGQTTASLFHTRRKDDAKLEKIFVQMKLSIVDDEKSETIIPKISEYANTQNKVNAADFFSNHPFHIRIEDFSRRLWAPLKKGEIRETKWFYERARGQYNDAQSKMKSSEKKKFKAEYPKPQMFAKTDLAKFENVWDEKPTFVNLGAQKNFAKYAERIGKKWATNQDRFNELYFKTVIARAIIFRKTEKLISSQPWYQGGYRANIVYYTLAMLSEYCKLKNASIDFIHIWKHQEIPMALVKSIEIVGKLVSDDISMPPEGVSNISEWCKKNACWDSLKEKVSGLSIALPEDFDSVLVSTKDLEEEVKNAVKTQKTDNGIDAQKEVCSVPPEKWKEMIEWGIKERIVSTKDIGILKVATQIPSKLPTEKQSLYLMKKLKIFQENGFKL